MSSFFLHDVLVNILVVSVVNKYVSSVHDILVNILVVKYKYISNIFTILVNILVIYCIN